MWGNERKVTYSYNSNDKIILRNFSEWMLSNWYEFARIQYTYSGSNQNLTQLNYYSFLSNAWYLDGYRVYTWNTNNYKTSIISYFIDPIFPNFYPPTWKDEFYYDSSNVLIVKTGLDYVGYSHWVNEINDLYFYDNSGNNNKNIRQEWNNTDST